MKFKKIKNLLTRLVKEMFRITHFLGLICIFAICGYDTLRIVKHEMSQIYYNLGVDYEKKMKMKITPQFFNFTQFIKRNTKKDSVILIPPQVNPWQEEGNGAYLYYFVFPRKVVSGDSKTLLTNKKITHVLITWGNPYFEPKSKKDFGWPKFKINAKKIFYMNNLNPELQAKVFTENYDPSDQINYQAYGLIEL